MNLFNMYSINAEIDKINYLIDNFQNQNVVNAGKKICEIEYLIKNSLKTIFNIARSNKVDSETKSSLVGLKNTLNKTSFLSNRFIYKCMCKIGKTEIFFSKKKNIEPSWSNKQDEKQKLFANKLKKHFGIGKTDTENEKKNQQIYSTHSRNCLLKTHVKLGKNKKCIY